MIGANDLFIALMPQSGLDAGYQQHARVWAGLQVGHRELDSWFLSWRSEGLCILTNDWRKRHRDAEVSVLTLRSTLITRCSSILNCWKLEGGISRSARGVDYLFRGSCAARQLIKTRTDTIWHGLLRGSGCGSRKLAIQPWAFKGRHKR